MGLWNAADKAGKRVEEERKMSKVMDDKKQEVKDEKIKEEKQHEENKKEGMI